MPPIWKPEEAEAKVYREVEPHSEGMISFTYRRPTAADMEALKNTATYRSVFEEQPQQSEPDGSLQTD